MEISSFDLNEFCKYVSSVLIAWKFPGECKVNFDTQSFDIQIDGQDRISNGKGVRALTHAAFKVAIMLYCRTNNLPHPGFMILDTPLLAYRDPIQHRGGELSDDEKEIANKSIKDAFFGHLLTISNLCQFIVIENIDPPLISEEFQKNVKIIQFTGVTGQGRKGFFP